MSIQGSIFLEFFVLNREIESNEIKVDIYECTTFVYEFKLLTKFMVVTGILKDCLESDENQVKSRTEH